ncbi:MAG: C10 family peptidase [Bacteroidales bacterium]|nr:C10 family peptidase [Bacteroidales bacterium]
MIRRITLILSLVFFVVKAFSADVDKTVAAKYAYEFISDQNKTDNDLSVRNVSPLSVQDVVYAWVINFSPEGWVLMSADDVVYPVLGFSFNGSFEVESLPNVPFNFWFEKNIGQQVLSAKRRKDLSRNSAWEPNGLSLKSTQSNVEPFIQVNWNQGSGWNNACPEDVDGPGGHAYAGCVAVAMGQAMSVFAHPAKGSGSHSYSSDLYGFISANYENADYYWDSMLVSSPNKHIAQLLFHLGVAVDMDYGPDGSGALSGGVPQALKSYFKYSNGIGLYKKEHYTDEDWNLLLKAELDAGRPIYYSGDPGNGESGHAFNIDGYYSDESFHLNWGWSGSYNGYYRLSSLSPGEYNFSVDQKAVLGIELIDYSPQDILLTNNKIFEGLPLGSFVGKVSVVDETPVDTFTFELHGPWSPISKQYTSTPFYISNDSLLSDKVFDYSLKSSYDVFIKVTDTELNELEKQFVITIKESIPAVISDISEGQLNEKDFFIYPVPASDILYIEGKDPQDIVISLYNLSGQRLNSFRSKNIVTQIPLSDLYPGFYFIEIYSKSKQPQLFKFLKK